MIEVCSQQSLDLCLDVVQKEDLLALLASPLYRPPFAHRVEIQSHRTDDVLVDVSNNDLEPYSHWDSICEPLSLHTTGSKQKHCQQPNEDHTPG